MVQRSAEVSVITAVYNGRDHVVQSIQSIQQQQDIDLQLIIADDGSTDGTAERVRPIAEADDRITLLELEHLGVVHARNCAIDQAVAPLLVIQDHDDIAPRHRLRTQVDFLLRHPQVVAAGSALQPFDWFGQPAPIYRLPPDHAEIDRQLINGLGNDLIHCTAAMRTDAVRRIGMYREGFLLAEDTDLLLRLAEIGELANQDACLLHRRIHPAANTASNRDIKHASLLRCINQARHRRGMPDIDKLPIQEAGADFDLTEFARHQALRAIHHRDLALARRYLPMLIRNAPWDKATWQTCWWAIKG